MFSEHPKFVKYLWLNTPIVQPLLSPLLMIIPYHNTNRIQFKRGIRQSGKGHKKNSILFKH